MAYDMVVVGAGPSGPAAAIRFKPLPRRRRTELSEPV